ncbi:hypothetical protein C8Q79DRAFT_998480 [Trametes meyenii]|nr:hypothetical protein C8Q79DRAFT_998480 [Trametes meyenii]
MSARYAPLPNPHTDPDAIHEMEAAFDDSDDDDDDPPQPLTSRSRNGYQSLPNAEPERPQHPSHDSQPAARGAPAQGAYDFENVDFDYIRPPPGSPPGPSARALPNEFGNSNGLVPSFSQMRTDATPSTPQGASSGWFRRTAQSILPSHYVQRLGLAGAGRPHGPVGGGTANDGVFANVTAKPSRGIRVQDGDEVYIVPEEVQKEVPPSYAQAQADAVPPYWETTIHAPSAANTAGDVIIDSLPTGSLFSFLWNMLVSISFQFVGFLLTYLLHTTHAAKLGSRAGLGITLIQYGFALRGRDPYVNATEQDIWGGWKPDEPRPTFTTAAEAEEYYKNLNITATSPTPTLDNTDGYISGDATTEWLSFLLMTMGWFILLTSVLGFWRVKRWERGILSTQEETAAPATPEEHARSAAIIHSIERAFGLHGLADGSLLRGGLGFPGAEHRAAHEEEEAEVEADDGAAAARNAYVLPIDPSDPERNERLARAYADEARLHQDLRSAGLL